MIKLNPEYRYFIWFHDEDINISVNPSHCISYETEEEAYAEAELTVADEPGLTYDIIEQETSYKSVKTTRKQSE